MTAHPEYFFPHMGLQAVPALTKIRRLRSAASEFTRRTRCWRLRVSISADADNETETPTLEHGAIIHEIERAWFDGVELIPAPFSHFTPDDLDQQDEGPPRYITADDDGESVRLVPRADGTLVMNLTLTLPSVTVASGWDFTLPDFMRTRYGDAIACGAAAQILAIPNMPWTDPNTAAYKRAMFESAVAAYSTTRMQGIQRAPMRTRASWF